MSFINDAIKGQLTENRIRVFFVSGAVTKWYNAQRTDKKTEVALLGGWYWALGNDERGPFRTPSAAMRDAYYRRIMETAPPLLSERDVERARRELAKHPKTQPVSPRNLALVRSA